METKICLFCGNRLYVLRSSSGGCVLPDYAAVASALPQSAELCDVRTNGGMSCKAAMLTEGEASAVSGGEWLELRPLFMEMGDGEFAAALKSKEILFWDEHSKFCPRCGVRTYRLTDIAKKCPECGYEMYPPISPAVIVRVSRGDEILMVHAHSFRGNHYGLVAGFLEAGETFEDCVRREVMEETGLKIRNLRYFGNQPWPFPSSQMVGFTAEYESGEIRIQEEELSDARFFGRDALPELPAKMSIARRLIDDWLGE